MTPHAHMFHQGLGWDEPPFSSRTCAQALVPQVCSPLPGVLSIAVCAVCGYDIISSRQMRGLLDAMK